MCYMDFYYYFIRARYVNQENIYFLFLKNARIVQKSVSKWTKKSTNIQLHTTFFIYFLMLTNNIVNIYIYIYMCVYKNLKEKFYSMKETSMWWSAIRKILNNYVNDCKLFIYYLLWWLVFEKGIYSNLGHKWVNTSHSSNFRG